MAQLRLDYELFRDRGVEIVVLGPEKREKFASYFSKNQLSFIGIPDPKHTVLRLYGQEVNLFKLGRMPAQVLIDRYGIARFVHYGKAMSDIPSNQEILEIIDKLNKETTGLPTS
jgi:peroxiredoxin Q/BCP